MKGKSTYIVIMKNILYSKLSIDEIYDLKGSSVGRDARVDNSQRNSGDVVVLKDNDFVSSNRKISLDKTTAQTLFKQIELDCQVSTKEFT